ncbi:hypothetical protein GCM10023196_003810 [Actinoallomurus vinaceus]|uniref:Uncharacterized protein n=2 Tax=Actinoallomurus vinaceus TaxID=1080074 RepID=A0ABP8TZK8_9ACTN
MPVTAADLTDAVELPVPQGLTIRHVTDRPGMRDLVNAYAEPLGFPSEAIDTMVERKLEYLSRDPKLIHLVGLLELTGGGSGRRE